MLVPSRCGAERVKRRCPGAAASAPRAAFPSVTRSEEGFILFCFFQNGVHPAVGGLPEPSFS